jgi:histidine ammonia-lyase
MIPHTAASIASQNKQLATSVDSIVSSNGQEDHVSMRMVPQKRCELWII